MLLKEELRARQQLWEDREEDISCYWTILKKKRRKYWNWKRKHKIALCRELTVEKDM
jgi:hypothetical protein